MSSLLRVPFHKSGTYLNHDFCQWKFLMFQNVKDGVWECTGEFIDTFQCCSNYDEAVHGWSIHLWKKKQGSMWKSNPVDRFLSAIYIFFFVGLLGGQLSVNDYTHIYQLHWFPFISVFLLKILFFLCLYSHWSLGWENLLLSSFG